MNRGIACMMVKSPEVEIGRKHEGGNLTGLPGELFLDVLLLGILDLHSLPLIFVQGL